MITVVGLADEALVVAGAPVDDGTVDRAGHDSVIGRILTGGTPLNTSDALGVATQLLEVSRLGGVGSMDVDGVTVDEGEVLTTMGELAVGDSADGDGARVGDGVACQVHEADTISEADEKMETGGVEGESTGFRGEVLDDFTSVVLKIPDTNSVI